MRNIYIIFSTSVVDVYLLWGSWLKCRLYVHKISGPQPYGILLIRLLHLIIVKSAVKNKCNNLNCYDDKSYTQCDKDCGPLKRMTDSTCTPNCICIPVFIPKLNFYCLCLHFCMWRFKFTNETYKKFIASIFLTIEATILDTHGRSYCNHLDQWFLTF